MFYKLLKVLIMDINFIANQPNTLFSRGPTTRKALLIILSKIADTAVLLL